MNTFDSLSSKNADIDPRSLIGVNKYLVCDQTQKLPSELFYDILRLSMMLSPSDFLQKLASVCRRWKKACYTILRDGEIINYRPIEKYYPETFNVNELIELDSRIKLHSLNFHGFKRTDKDELKILTKLKNLNKLNIACSECISKESLSNFTQLTELDASYCDNFENNAIEEIACLTQLQLLHISCLLGIGEDLEPITRLTRLEDLTISNFIEFNNDGISIIAKLSKLSKLSLLADEHDNRYDPIELNVHTISQLKNLKSLQLKNCTDTTDVFLWGMGKLKQLEHLKLESGDQFTDITIANIGRLTLLRRLDLRWSCEHITDAGLKKLSRLIHLENLNLCGSKSLSGIAFDIFPQLKCLKLAASSITDIVLKKMIKLSKLRKLSFLYCHQITYSGLLQITKLTNLTKLRLSGCNLITPEKVLKWNQYFNVDHSRFLSDILYIHHNSEEGEKDMQDNQVSEELEDVNEFAS